MFFKNLFYFPLSFHLKSIIASIIMTFILLFLGTVYGLLSRAECHATESPSKVFIPAKTFPLDVSSEQYVYGISTCCSNGDVAPLGSIDGFVNVADALIALRFALKLEPGHPTSDELCHGDVAPLDSTGQPDPDGQITVADALVILRKALSLVTWELTVPTGYVHVEAGTDAGNYVTVNEPFYISKYEVTNQQMADLMQWAYDQDPPLINATSSSVTNSQGVSQELLDLDDDQCQISFTGGTFSVDSGMGNYPCVEVSWYGALAYCNYLSIQEGRTSAYDISDWTLVLGADGYRLPSEDQWEYAARGGKDGTDTEYSGSDNIDEVGWYRENSDAPGNSNFYNDLGTLPVGQKDPNELGMYDMTGNLWEWCNGSYRVMRGGSWISYAIYSRILYRSSNGPEYGHYYIGFRPVLPADQ